MMVGACKRICTQITLLYNAHILLVALASHIESRSSVFGTALNYVVLRLLGVDAEHPMMIKARATLHSLGESCVAFVTFLLGPVLT